VWRTAISTDSVTTELAFAKMVIVEAIVQSRVIISLVSAQSIACEVACSNAITRMTRKGRKPRMNATTCVPKSVFPNASQERCRLTSLVALLVFPQFQSMFSPVVMMSKAFYFHNSAFLFCFPVFLTEPL
jgi:hypothetical protein